MSASSPKGALLVGSVPLADSEQVFRAAVEILGDRLRRVPDGDLPMMLKQQAKRKHKVYFVRELERGGEPALRALNIRREYFTELRTRVVFWLTPNEEKQLAHYATDFWSIRHRTVHLSR